ncbi:NTP transferase domain-containing protein [Promicromonospora sp. NPDC023987]|uniref:molybdenum cofactor guanylyltransferase n=1 Tax=Promicromonospora sp. NPDC023987 TaxID=3155360 RepID=UPI0034005AA9
MTDVAGVAYDAVVLAGGRAARLGGASKAGLVVDGARLLDRALEASTRARAVVVVGPPELAESLPGPAAGEPGPRLVLTQEDPPFGGPVAGVAAGLRAVPASSAPWVLLLAVDVPHAAEAIGFLERTVSREPVDGAYLVRDGRPQWLVGLYRRAALDRVLGEIQVDGAAMRRLVGGLPCTEVPDPAGWSDDIDTPADAARLGAAAEAARFDATADGPARGTDDDRKDPR